MPRFFCAAQLSPGALLNLPAGAARHVQVLRLQPNDAITLFNGGPGWDQVGAIGGEYRAVVTEMGRSHVQVQVESHIAVERQPLRQIHLLVGMPANERMDWLVEKATELGVASIQPLMTERSVVRLAGDRADKKVAHWQSVAISASEQCGGNMVPTIHSIKTLSAWLKEPSCAALEPSKRWLLSLRQESTPLRQVLSDTAAGATGYEHGYFLSGPEGGLSHSEEEAAISVGFTAVSLGLRVLRAETAALTALATLTL